MIKIPTIYFNRNYSELSHDLINFPSGSIIAIALITNRYSLKPKRKKKNLSNFLSPLSPKLKKKSLYFDEKTEKIYNCETNENYLPMDLVLLNPLPTTIIYHSDRVLVIGEAFSNGENNLKNRSGKKLIKIKNDRKKNTFLETFNDENIEFEEKIGVIVNDLKKLLFSKENLKNKIDQKEKLIEILNSKIDIQKNIYKNLIKI